MEKILYTKPSLAPTQQIELLSERGILFSNKEQSEKYLTYHNYYYISGYIYYFEKKDSFRTHQFKKQINFNDIVLLVNFDQTLREQCFNALQTIEIAIRSSIARNLSLLYGPFCLEKKDIFRREDFNYRLIEIIKKSLVDHRNEAFITHFSNKYTNPIPPVWVIIEILTIGNISAIYGYLKTELQKRIAADFNIDHTILESWLKAITELRNTCAHHARLWNKVFVNHPKIRKIDEHFPIQQNMVNRLGSFIPLIIHFLCLIDEKTDWENKVLSILKGCSLIKPSDLGLTQWWK
ncbi:MAG: putative phage AbiD protein [uncultured bacterium]|nr:MAG: putative phage AbiD protein [uncultured bacterium]